MSNYPEFFKLFGGSYRTKNIIAPELSLKNIKQRLHQLRIKKDHSRNLLSNKRYYSLPVTSKLPNNFIRLCPWEAEYIYAIASRTKIGILETGRFHGGSTFMMAWANRTIPIHSIDIAPQNDELLTKYFSEFGIGKNVDLIIGDSQNAKYSSIDTYDLLYIDGDHSYEGCTKDLENWYSQLEINGHIILHDCYFGSPVQQSVIDFMQRHDVMAIRSPYINASYWQTEYGSITHLIKKGLE